MPRRRVAFKFWGYALGVAFGPNKLRAKPPDQGHSPKSIWLLAAGHSYRLTSGGTAELIPPMTFETILNRC